MAILATEYNRGPTNTPANQAEPSDYGRQIQSMLAYLERFFIRFEMMEGLTNEN